MKETTMSTPETFEAHGHTWTSHKPGDPMPCDGNAFVQTIWRQEVNGSMMPPCGGQAHAYDWGKKHDPDEDNVGWRYASPAAPPVEEKETVASVCAKVSQITDDVIDELATLREENASMRTAIQSASSSFTHIDDHPSDFTSPELFYWNAKNQCRAALATLRPYLL